MKKKEFIKVSAINISLKMFLTTSSKNSKTNISNIKQTLVSNILTILVI